jgi:hypothetical protein
MAKEAIKGVAISCLTFWIAASFAVANSSQ